VLIVMTARCPYWWRRATLEGYLLFSFQTVCKQALHDRKLKKMCL